MGKFQIFPDAAATNAGAYDPLFYFESIVTVVMVLLIFTCVAVFAFKYRRRPGNEITPLIHGSTKLEITWSVIPLLVMLVMFFWGTKIYFDNGTPPANAIDIYVVGKQWMWKVQYPGGQREINELHVPMGRPVKLTLASEDVIHSFFVPAFRLKRDVVPGHYNTDVVHRHQARPLSHLFCAEYCGTKHSGMIGWVTVMDPARLRELAFRRRFRPAPWPQQGEKLFQQFGCVSCHLLDQQGRCPTLRDVYGHACNWTTAAR